MTAAPVPANDLSDAPTAPTPFFVDAMDALTSLRAMMTPDRITTDEYGLLIAQAVALRADCTRRRVGAVIVDVHGRVVGTGRNGAPPGRPGCLSASACPRGQLTYEQVAPGSSYASGAGACIAVHAETNALLFSAPQSRQGGSIFITDQPCDDCSKMLAGSGLDRAVWPEQRTDGTWQVRSILIGEAPIGGWLH